MVLHKKILRTMKERKGQYIGSILLILISSMLFSVFNIAGINVELNLDRFKEENVIEDAYFLLQQPLSNINQLEEDYNIILEERKSYDYRYQDDKTLLRLLQETNKVNKYALVEGDDLKKDKQILVDKGFANAHNLQIGEKIDIEDDSFTIVGYMTTPDYIYPLKSEGEILKNPNTFGIAIVSEKDFQAFSKALTFYSIKFNENNKDAFKNELNKTNTILKWVNAKDNNRISFIQGDIKGVKKMGETLPIAILILSSLLVSIILWRLIKGEVRQIGTLYAIGYRKKEILFHYLRYSFWISFIGSILGTILGGILVEPLLYAFSGFYNLPVLVVEYLPSYLLISFLLPSIFIIPITAMVMNRILKLAPLSLLRGGQKKTKVNWLERHLKLSRVSFYRKYQMREWVRNIPRTILLILGVTAASMLLLLGFATKDSMDYMVEGFTDVYTYQHDYIFRQLQMTEPESGEKVTMTPFYIKDNDKKSSLMIYGIEPDSQYLHLRDMKNKDIPLNKHTITKSLADKLNVSSGDQIKVINKLNDKTYTVKIDAVASFYTGDFVYMPIEQFNQTFDYPKESYLELWSSKPLDMDKQQLLTSTNRDELLSGYQDMIEPIRYMIGVIAVIAFAIGLVIIYVVTSLLIEENKMSISLFKILGYSKKEIYRLILNSNTWLVLLGYILSIPLINLTLDAFFKAISADLSFSMPVKLNPINIAIGFIIMMVTYEISKRFSRKKITSISMADVLKSNVE